MENIQRVDDEVANYERGEHDDPEYFVALSGLQQKLYRELERLEYREGRETRGPDGT